MTLAGDPVEAYLRIVRTYITALGASLEDALLQAPDNIREEVRSRYLAEVAQPIRRARVLSGDGGPRPWFSQWDPSQGYYWRRLRDYLIDIKGRTQREVEALDDASDKILSHLEDPRPSGPSQFGVRGLVLGHVQGGKTANISAVIAKCADVGYRFVIVLSGVHDALRKQTQQRLSLEMGFTRRGVGLPKAGHRWQTLTGEELDQDFRPGTVGSAVLQGNDPVIAVMKKNSTVLKRLIRWIDGSAPSHLPVLIIDDEADQASINTGGNRGQIQDYYDLPISDTGEFSQEEETDPSTINRLIRELVSSFERTTYIAYTATPFANILISPDAFDREVYEDLYPKDFIVSLTVGPSYVGAERLFGRPLLEHEPDQEARDGLNLVEIVPEGDQSFLLPPPRGASSFEPQIPPSLETAIRDFVLLAAAKIERLGNGIASMLIHTSHLTLIQNRLAEKITGYLHNLRRDWRYGDTEGIRLAFESRWNTAFRPITSSFNTKLDTGFARIEPHITKIFKDNEIRVLVLNDTSEDELDYERHPDLKAILVGGNRLSRGLTIEDLLVSYYVRRVNMYDTLLQMARWFGYRENYIDLTRLWTTAELVRRFRHLALVEEEIRDQIAIYELNNITPKEFGPRIRTHPGMEVTARNKMGSGRKVSHSYSGALVQTTRFRFSNRAWLESNLSAARRFMMRLGVTNIDNRPEWRGVAWQHIVEFLNEYQTAEDASSMDATKVRRYIQRQAEGHGELIRWIVSVRSLRNPQKDLGTVDLHIPERPPVNAISRSRLGFDPESIGVLTSPARTHGPRYQGDEEVGLTEEQIDRARARRNADNSLSLGHLLREERPKGEGLLLIYPISPFSKAKLQEDKNPNKNRVNLFDNPVGAPPVVGIAFSFPFSESGASVDYITGPAGRREELEDEP